MRQCLKVAVLGLGVGLGITSVVSPVVAQAPAGVIREVRIEGTQRIDPATVQSYMVVNPGDPFDIARVNQSLKSLYATGLFADVSMERQGGALVVKVVENPIINRIAFEGNYRIEDEELEAEVQLRPRVVYTRTRVQNDVQRILDIYQRSGRFSARVEPKVIELEQNRVDLVFEVDEGDETGIRRIIFVGNKRFTDSKLRGEIATQESRWWAFFRATDTYDPDRLSYDREVLRRFYLMNGYADFRVLSAIAELTPDREDFFITFTLEEGERYRFGEAKIDTKIVDLDTTPLMSLIQHENGEWYNAEKVEETVSKLTDGIGDYGYAFVDIRPRIDKDPESRVINITYEIGEGPKVYVERIDIRGNFRTEDRVIRREFRFVEGDAFNTSKMRRSQQRIKNLGFFSKVDINTVPGSSPERTVVEVDVEEKSTGELSFGLGYSTSDGAMGDISIRERNLLGKGQELRLSFSGSFSSQQFDVGFTEPYLFGRPLSGGVDLFSVSRDRQSESSYDEQEYGGRLRFGYRITESLSQSLRYTLRRVEISDVGDDASIFVQSQEGEETISELGQTLLYDQRDNRFMPTEGYFARLTTDVAGLGGTLNYVKTMAETGYYYSVFDDVVLSTSATLGSIEGLDQDIRLADRFFLGGARLRGFQTSGVGPRDTSTGDSLGGQRMAYGSTELRFPLGLPEELGVTGRAFADYGSLWGVPESGQDITDTGAIRFSVGAGIGWVSPFGPIALDYAFPLMKEDHDQTENFRVSFGTNF